MPSTVAGTRRRTAVLALVALLGVAVTASAQSAPLDESWLRWRNRPSIQLGPHIRVDVHARFAHDWRALDTSLEDASRWRLRRAGLEGEITDHLEFEIEHDLNAGGEWRDVFVNWRSWRPFELRAGRFKVPFGREQMTSIAHVDFAERALVSSTISPARAIGIMTHGRFWGRGLTYEVGVFDGDGDNAPLRRGTVPGVLPVWTGPAFAARVTAVPLRRLGGAWRTLRFGAAVSTVDIPEGLNSLRGESLHETVEFFPPVYVNGRRIRTGLEMTYTAGPVGLSAEWMQARDQRKRQGIGDVDLSDVMTRGWYVAATWLVTGEDKDDFNAPRRPLFEGGIGAVEFAARYELLTFGSATRDGPAFRNPRAEHILGNGDRIWTVGVNWFANRWTRLTANAVHESFDDPVRTPLPGVTRFWSGIFRAQVAF
jgi:phosphate-selective porin OprO/OprP